MRAAAARRMSADISRTPTVLVKYRMQRGNRLLRKEALTTGEESSFGQSTSALLSSRTHYSGQSQITPVPMLCALALGPRAVPTRQAHVLEPAVQRPHARSRTPDAAIMGPSKSSNQQTHPTPPTSRTSRSTTCPPGSSTPGDGAPPSAEWPPGLPWACRTSSIRTRTNQS
jgi:hypothetical protein